MAFEKYILVWNGEELEGTTWTEDSDVEINCGKEQKTSLDLDEVRLIYQDENKNTYSGYKNGKWVCEFSVVPDSESDLICKKKIRG